MSSDHRKTVLITGATPGGIGEALSHRFQRAGYRVFPTARRLSVLAPLSAVGMEPVDLDVTSPDSVAACLSTVTSLTGGTLDVLVNNAGVSIPAPSAELDVDGVVKRLYDTNVFGPMRMVKAFAPLLVASAGKGAKPCIVNIGSIGPAVNFAFGGAYNGAKAAVASWGDCLRLELRPFGVDVVTVVTGAVRSNIVDNNKDKELMVGSLYEPIVEWFRKRVNASQAKGESMETGEFARGVVDMVEGRRREWFWWGGRWRIAWWAGNVFPRWVVDWIMARKYGLLELARIVNERRIEEREKKLT